MKRIVSIASASYPMFVYCPTSVNKDEPDSVFCVCLPVLAWALLADGTVRPMTHFNGEDCLTLHDADSSFFLMNREGDLRTVKAVKHLGAVWLAARRILGNVAEGYAKIVDDNPVNGPNVLGSMIFSISENFVDQNNPLTVSCDHVSLDDLREFFKENMGMLSASDTRVVDLILGNIQ